MDFTRIKYSDYKNVSRAARRGEAAAFARSVALLPEQELPEDCILWPFYVSKAGYGVATLGDGSRAQTSHRVVYVLRHCALPPGMCVRHKCRNRSCCNPKHIEEGTHQDNIGKDMARDGTTPKGESHYAAKLSENLVKRIRRRRRSGGTYAAIALSFGVSPAAVKSVCRGTRWAHLNLSPIDTKSRPCVLFGEEYGSMADAARATGTPEATVFRWCHGKPAKKDCFLIGQTASR